VLAAQVRATECAVEAIPVPERETVAGEFPALLEKVAIPLAPPLPCGAKVIVTEVEFPAVTVKGVLALVLYPGLLKVIDETETLAVPELERVTVFELLLPTFTFPNERETGEAFSDPTAVETPVPVKVTTSGELLRLLTMDAEPLALPTL